MSIRINNKIISGTYTTQSYRYVGEIFQSALPIEDSRVALLDGHKIYESEGYGSFIQYITSLALLYPQLSCTEDEWQEANTTYGECGKFVISEDGVRLPKIVSFVQGLSSLQDLATLVEAGLPNITTGIIAGHSGITSELAVGALKFGQSTTKHGTYNVINTNNDQNLSFDASLSNPIYGNSITVQPQSIRYPYYIVLATGVTQEVKVKEELTTNIPFTLFESKYSEVELNNTSWLLSSGQWNSKELYPSAYNELVKEYNAGSNKYSIKLYTDEYGDYDFVLNLDDETFRLPLKSKLASGKAVVGNGTALGLQAKNAGSTTTPVEFGMQLAINVSSAGTLLASTTSKGASVSQGNANTDINTLPYGGYPVGISSIEEYSGIETSTQGLYLYFYVGDTNINVSLVDTGKLTQEVANLIPNNSGLISGYGMPSDRYIDLELGASETAYTAPANGWFDMLWVTSSTSNYGNLINAVSLLGDHKSSTTKGAHMKSFVPARKNDEVIIQYYNMNTDSMIFRFVYAEGDK